MTTYAVKVIGHGIIFRSVEPKPARERAAMCVPQAQARVLTIPGRR